MVCGPHNCLTKAIDRALGFTLAMAGEVSTRPIAAGQDRTIIAGLEQAPTCSGLTVQAVRFLVWVLPQAVLRVVLRLA